MASATCSSVVVLPVPGGAMTVISLNVSSAAAIETAGRGASRARTRNADKTVNAGIYPRARDRAVVAVDPIAEAGGEKPKKFSPGCPDPQSMKLDKLGTVSALRSAIIVVRLSPRKSWIRNP
jgi:hypothetical protein